MTRERLVSFGFVFFVVLHVAAWTLAPALLRFSLPMDAMEGFTWGQHLSWGYDKNPFLNAWLTRLALTLDGRSGWMVYLFSQLSVATGFCALWRLGRQMMPSLYVLLGVMMLEGLQYTNFHAIDFNDNTLELALWPLLICFFYQAVREGRLKDWLFTGLFAGLAMMTKYYAAVLLLPLFLFLLSEPVGRRVFRQPGIYAAMGVFAAVILPHVLWLFSHDFITVRYALARTDAPSSPWNHVYFPLNFLWEQFQVLIPGLILLLPLAAGKPFPALATLKPLRQMDRRFLLFAGLGPLTVTLLLAAVAGIRLRAGWGQPLLICSGLLLLSQCRPVVTRLRLKIFLSLFAAFFVAAVSGYTVAMMRADSPSSAVFPGRELSAQLIREWHHTFQWPLQYVVGPRWLAGSVAFYADEPLTVYMEADSRRSPWIDETALKKAGALFVWEADNADFEKDIRRRFTGLSKTRILTLPYSRNGAALPKVVIKTAFSSPS